VYATKKEYVPVQVGHSGGTLLNHLAWFKDEAWFQGSLQRRSWAVAGHLRGRYTVDRQRSGCEILNLRPLLLVARRGPHAWHDPDAPDYGLRMITGKPCGKDSPDMCRLGLSRCVPRIACFQSYSHAVIVSQHTEYGPKKCITRMKEQQPTYPD
jgi:hypothetical protein